MEYIYGALLLHKLGKPVDEEHLKKVITAAGAHVDEGKIKTLLASLQGVDISVELENANNMTTAPVATAPKKEEKKEEETPSESAAGLSALFG